jgi:large subunit ribosomal protein L33
MLARGAVQPSRATFAVPACPSRAAAPRDVVCMAKKKGVRCIVTVECTEARGLGETPSRYTTQKNKKNTPGRLEIKKYNKYLKRMTVHKEIK